MVATRDAVVPVTGGQRGLGKALVDAAARIIDAPEAGSAEVLVDDISVGAKAALSGPVEKLSVSMPG